jgi:lambda family phage portal protein
MGWGTQRQEINSEIKSDLPALRARTYDALFNNPFVAALDWEDRYYVIGPEGFDLQPRAKYPTGLMDDFANGIIKSGFDKWSRKNYCHVGRRYSFLMMQYLMRSMLRADGEVILRTYTKGNAVKGNPFGFTLDFIDPNDIDHIRNRKNDDGTYVIMGVHIDEFRRLLGIYIKPKSIDQELTLGYNGYGSNDYIPADELIFGFDPKHYKQIHGITSLSASLLRIRDLDMWVEYSLQNAKYGASVAAYLKDVQPDSDEYEGDETEEQTDENASSNLEAADPRYMEVNGLRMVDLPWGREPQFHDPKYPSDQHDPFVRSIGRDVMMADGKDYAVISGDRAGESYSSGRTGELKMMASYAYNQSITRELWLVDIYERWITAALRSNALAPLQFAMLEKYKEHYWQGYKKPWVDPLKKVMSDKLEEEMGYKSKIDNTSERGRRMEEIFEDRRTYEKLVEKYGVDIEHKEGTQIIVNENNDEPSDPENEKDKQQRTFGNIIKLG